MLKRLGKTALFASAGSLVAAPALYFFMVKSDHSSFRLDSGDVRSGIGFSRALSNAVITAVDYKLSLYGLSEDSQIYTDRLKAAHDRAGRRLLRVCLAEGGIYNKFGQYVGAMTTAVPKEITSRLSVLHDQVPPKPWKTMSQVFREDFDKPLEELFTHVDQNPIAAASLAQVHRAVRKGDGKEVAVKFQYPHISSQIESCLAMLNVFQWILGKFFTNFDVSWILKEFRLMLLNELDFKQEGLNSSRLNRMFEEDKQIAVPWIDWKLTSKRVLTMEFVRGIKISDIDGLEKEGIDPKAVASLLCRFFATTLFYHGFIHCDLHPGNVFVKQIELEDGTLKPCLIILDHGMYRRLNPEFRRDFCTLWKALILQDQELGKVALKRLNAPEDGFELLSLVLTHRLPTSKLSSFGEALHAEDRKTALEKIKNRNLADALRFVESLPRDLMWVIRTTNFISALNHRLGGTTRSRFRINNDKCVEGLYLSHLHLNAFFNEMKQPSAECADTESKCSSVEDFSNAENPEIEAKQYQLLSSMKLLWKNFAGNFNINLPVASEISYDMSFPLKYHKLSKKADLNFFVFDNIFSRGTRGTNKSEIENFFYTDEAAIEKSEKKGVKFSTTAKAHLWHFPSLVIQLVKSALTGYLSYFKNKLVSFVYISTHSLFHFLQECIMLFEKLRFRAKLFTADIMLKIMLYRYFNGLDSALKEQNVFLQVPHKHAS